jgi:predicted anti-sigma-YlaC factor YlaD
VQAVPDLVEVILAQAPLPRRRRPRERATRWALGIVGAAQCGLGVAEMLTTMVAAAHNGTQTSSESAAWNVALGVAFIWSAIRVRQARGILPVLTTFTAIVLALSMLDISTGQAGYLREAWHLLTLLGLMLVIRLIRSNPSQGPPSAAPPRASHRRQPPVSA